MARLGSVIGCGVLLFLSGRVALSEPGPYNIVPDHKKVTVTPHASSTFLSVPGSEYMLVDPDPENPRYEWVDYILNPYTNPSRKLQSGKIVSLKLPATINLSSLPGGRGIVLSQIRGSLHPDYLSQGLCAAFRNSNRNVLTPSIPDPERYFPCDIYQIPQEDLIDLFNVEVSAGGLFPIVLPVPNGAFDLAFTAIQIPSPYNLSVELDAYLEPAIVTDLKVYHGDEPPGPDQDHTKAILTAGEWAKLEMHVSLAEPFWKGPIEKHPVVKLFLNDNPEPFHEQAFNFSLDFEDLGGGYFKLPGDEAGFRVPENFKGTITAGIFIDKAPVSLIPGQEGERPQVEVNSGISIQKFEVSQSVMNPAVLGDEISLVRGRNAAAVLTYTVPDIFEAMGKTYKITLYLNGAIMAEKNFVFSTDYSSPTNPHQIKQFVEFPVTEQTQGELTAEIYADETLRSAIPGESGNMHSLQLKSYETELRLKYVRIVGCDSAEPCYSAPGPVTSVSQRENFAKNILPITNLISEGETDPFAKGSSINFLFSLGAILDWIELENKARTEGIEKLVAVVSSEYFDFHGVKAFGFTCTIGGDTPRAVFVQEHTSITLAHELGHALGVKYEDYENNFFEVDFIPDFPNDYLGQKIEGYHHNKNVLIAKWPDHDQQDYANIMYGTSLDLFTSDLYWIDKRTHEITLENIIDKQISTEKVSIISIFYSPSDGFMKKIISTSEGGALSQNDENGDTLIEIKDEQGNLIQSLKQSTKISVHFSSGSGSIPPELETYLNNSSIVQITIPYREDAHSISIQKEGATEVSFAIQEAKDPFQEIHRIISFLEESELKKPWRLRKFLLSSTAQTLLALKKKGKYLLIKTNLRLLELQIKHWVKGTAKQELLKQIFKAREFALEKSKPKNKLKKKKSWWKRWWQKDPGDI